MNRSAKPAKPAKSLGEEVAEALGAEKTPRPAADELADRERGSPGPIAADESKP